MSHPHCNSIQSPYNYENEDSRYLCHTPESISHPKELEEDCQGAFDNIEIPSSFFSSSCSILSLLTCFLSFLCSGIISYCSYRSHIYPSQRKHKPKSAITKPHGQQKAQPIHPINSKIPIYTIPTTFPVTLRIIVSIVCSLFIFSDLIPKNFIGVKIHLKT